jgi:Lrp/AsnC family leucine-responsive transcriptional regulator
MKAKDVALLMALQENGRAGLKELAKAAGMPLSTAHDRVRQLEKEGVIKKYAAILDAEKVGKPATSFVLISLRYRSEQGKQLATFKQIAERISSIPIVQEAYVITGEWDIILKVRGGSTREIGEFVFDVLREIPGVDKTLTFESFYSTKEAGAIHIQAEGKK